MVSGTRSGRPQNEGPSVPPGQIASVPTPPEDLSNHKNTIAYALGELNTTVRQLSDAMAKQTETMEKLKENIETRFKEQKDSIKAIEDKILIADTQVKSAFYTTRWFLIALTALVTWCISNLPRVLRLLDLLK